MFDVIDVRSLGQGPTQRRRVPLIIHTNNSHRGQHAARHARQAVGGVKMLNFQARGISATRNDTALIAALRNWQHKGSCLLYTSDAADE